MVANVYVAQNAGDLINLATHIINNVDLPSGFIQSINNGATETDTTQWVVFKDITRKVFYYRTYNDLTLRSIDMFSVC